MSVTAIKGLTNNSSEDAIIQDYENPDKVKNSATASPNSTADCNLWIPWCTSVEDFNNGHYLTIETQASTHWLWQENRPGDGDFVRYSTDHYYHLNAPHVDGFANAGGDRIATVDSSGAISLSRTG